MTSPKLPFETALVTGASSGIGRALSVRLARGGARVALVARRRPELEAVAAECPGAIVLPADLSRPEEAMRVVAEAEVTLGRLELVVCNAGVGSGGAVLDVPWAAIERTVAVNALAAMAVIRAALPAMAARHSGTIAGISSLASYRGLPDSAAYSASKAALSTFLEAVRAETRDMGIAIVDIHPGFIRTPMTAKHTFRMPFLMEVDSAADKILRAIVRKVPVYDFPWQMAVLFKLIRVLPARLFDAIAGAQRKSR